MVNEAAVDFAVYRADQKDAFIVHNSSGQARVEYNNGSFVYKPITGDPLQLKTDINVHGHRAALETTFESEYPDSLFQIYQLFQSDKAGDIVISAKVGYDLRDFWEYAEHKGSHGSLHRSHMHVPLIYNQKNWHSHPARTADLFNSILKWKDIIPSCSEGESLF